MNIEIDVKKVVVLSYYYPPSSFVGGQRTDYWAKNLSKHGVFPIIISRKWNPGQKDLFGSIKNNKLTIVKKEDYEIHYLPVKSTLKNRISNKPYLSLLRKSLTFMQMILGRIHITFSPYKDFYSYTKDILEKDSEINHVIVSATPFEMFQVGYFLKKKYNIKWIPDYRDEWNTHQNNDKRNNSLIRSFLLPLDKKSELKWTRNSDYFISVSENWVDNISEFINIKGYVVMNGYKSYDVLPDKSKKDTFKIVYAGTIYASQPIEVFIEAIDKLISDIQFSKIKIEVFFIGTEIEPFGYDKLIKLTNNKSHYNFIPRINKEDLNREIAESDLLLLTRFDNVKGWYPVKLFEYYATGKHILLAPSDSDVMEDFILKSNCGDVCYDVDSCSEILYRLINNKLLEKSLKPIHNHQYAQNFSRESQTKKLASIIIQN